MVLRRSTPYSINEEIVEVIDLTQVDAVHAAKKQRLKVEDLEAQIPLLSIEEENDNVPNFAFEDLTEDDGDDGNEWLRELSQNEAREFQLRHTRSATAPPADTRAKSVTTPLDAVITVDVSVELIDGDFLYVKSIKRKADGTYLKGILLRRNCKNKDLLPKKYNELCAILKTYADAEDPAIDECLVTRPLDDVLTVRKIVFTNEPFPALSFRDASRDGGKERYASWNEVQDTAILVCRWKHTEFCEGNKVVSQTIMQLNEKECTTGISAGVLRKLWRGDEEPSDDDDTEMLETTVVQKYRHVGRLGIYEKRTDSVTTESIKFRPAKDRTTVNKKSELAHFTYGDVCTGAGGTARGADQAGLPLSFFLDSWSDACKTQKQNWRGVPVLHMDIYEFLTEFPDHAYLRVDVLHISFPCQPHSSAHTKDGKNDDANIAAGYSAIPILRKCKPRVVTLEQTSGIMTHNGGWHFRALVHQLTAVGYSVRTKIVNCADYGNVQARKRLFIIASCPGETLPPFPKPTHGTGRGMKPLVTIRDIRNKLRNFEIEPHMRSSIPRDGKAYNDRGPLKQCITTSGGESNLHPKGKRTFNLQELACLAGFPPTHRFFGSEGSIKRQIGNAVPACVAKAIFEQIIKTMRQTDKEIAAWKPECIELD
ncbi:hypothetical protein LTR37_011705 [Vermiconidia calcicola]|uniref:Uncharacterized protein n=1 Tax=Vermiconidia calcicola TaxID=1690605 RepID=A0ACC3N2Z4_9PEZI|nr:hypothetical protein LTR37_011705 [Vermiconidia calcicola]